jgi:hypothetical protein
LDFPLEAEIKELRSQRDQWLERWACIENNAHQYGYDPDKLFAFRSPMHLIVTVLRSETDPGWKLKAREKFTLAPKQRSVARIRNSYEALNLFQHGEWDALRAPQPQRAIVAPGEKPAVGQCHRTQHPTLMAFQHGERRALATP